MIYFIFIIYFISIIYLISITLYPSYHFTSIILCLIFNTILNSSNTCEIVIFFSFFIISWIVCVIGSSWLTQVWTIVQKTWKKKKQGLITILGSDSFGIWVSQNSSSFAQPTRSKVEDQGEEELRRCEMESSFTMQIAILFPRTSQPCPARIPPPCVLSFFIFLFFIFFLLFFFCLVSALPV
jgi:hypothetical protein